MRGWLGVVLVMWVMLAQGRVWGGDVPPTLTGLAASVTTNRNTATPAQPFTIGDDLTPSASLAVTVQSSSNPTVIPTANCVLGGSNTNRTLTITPASGQTGTSTVTLRVTDGDGLFTEDTIAVTVNGPPTMTGLTADVTTNRNTATPAQPFTIGDDLTQSASLAVTVQSSSNPTVIPTANCVLGGSGTNRTLTITPASGQTGTSTVTVRVTDGGGLFVEDTIVVTVNGPPTMTGLAPTVQINRNTPTSALAFTIGDDLTAAVSLNVSVQSSSNPTLIPTWNCALGGNGANRTVTITPASGQTGTSTVTLRVTDAGGLFAEGTIAVTVNGPPTVTGLNSPLTINQFENSGALPFLVGDDLTPAANLNISVTSSNTTVIPVINCVVTTITGVNNRSLLITPVSGLVAANPITITVRVTDGSGLFTEIPLTVTVREINRPPVITPPTAHNYSLKVSGYTQILSETVNVTDPDGQPTLKTGSDYLRITARISVNRVANEDSMELRATEKCKLVRRGSNYDIRWLTTSGTLMADVSTADDGSLTITVLDGAQTVANSGTPPVGSAAVLAELLKTINYTNQAGRFADITPPTRTVEIQVIEGRPAGMPNGQTPTTLTSVITLLLDNEPPRDVAFETVVVSPGGIGRIVFAADVNGKIPRFDQQTANDDLQISVNSPPNGGQVIDLATNQVITTNVAGSRLNPANPGGIGYRNGNPNFASDGFTLRVADAGNLGAIANVLVRIDSNATGEARFVSDPLLVMDRGASKQHQVTIVGPTLTDVVLGVTRIDGQALSPSPVTGLAGALKTDANGSAQTTLTITAPATGLYLEFMLTCTIGGSTAKQPYLIRLMPVIPFAASN